MTNVDRLLTPALTLVAVAGSHTGAAGAIEGGRTSSAIAAIKRRRIAAIPLLLAGFRNSGVHVPFPVEELPSGDQRRKLHS
jgi:hypothetical protein